MRQIPLTVDSLKKSNLGEDALTNLYPQPIKSIKGQFRLVNTPGLKEHTYFSTGPVIGIHEVNGRTFAITPTEFNELTLNGVLNRGGSGAVNFPNYQFAFLSIASSSRYVVMTNGTYCYAFDMFNNTFSNLTNVAGFYPSDTVTFQDGYFIFNRNDTGQFFISRLNDITFNPLDYASAEGNGDNVTAVISNQRELMVFGRKTISIWYHAGGPFAFAKNLGAFIERGTIMPHAVKKINNTVFFVGDDLVIYKLVGYTPVRISNRLVESFLRLTNPDSGITSAYVYADDGSFFYVINIFVGSYVTFAYDILTGSWHRRKSPGRGDSVVRHVARDKWGRIIAGGEYGRNIYIMSLLETQEYPPRNSPNNVSSEDIERVFVLPVINENREYMHINALELDATINLYKQATYTLEVSKRDIYRFGNKRVLQISENELGKRVRWRRLGTAREFLLKITLVTDGPVDIGGVYIGTS